MRSFGKKIRKAGFLVEGHKLYGQMYPHSIYTDPVTQVYRYSFKFSRNWFARFQRPFGISLRVTRRQSTSNNPGGTIVDMHGSAVQQTAGKILRLSTLK